VELKQYFELARRWLWLLVLGTVLGAASAFVVSRLQEPVYQASTTMLISEAPRGNTSVDYQAITGASLAGTYLQLLTSRPVLDEVILRLNLGLSAGQLANSIRVELVSNTQLIRLHVEDTDPQRAAAIANTLPVVFSEYNETQQASRFADSKTALTAEIASVDAQITDLQGQIAAIGTPADAATQTRLDRLQEALTQLRQSRTSLVQSFENLRLAEAQSINNVVVVESALEPRTPIRPRTLQNTALAAVVGLMLAAGTAFLIEYLDDTIKSPEQVTALLQLPVIGIMARLTAKELAAGPVARVSPRSPTTEAFRSLRTNLQYAGVDNALHTLLVTSVGPGEGKSTIVANLAIVLAQSGQRVAVLDADLRRPMQHRLLDRPNRYGLSETLLQDPLHLNGALQAIEGQTLNLISSGSVPPNPAELLGSRKMTGLLNLLGEQAERIIIDSPPVSVVTDAVILANQVDGVILVLEAGRTRMGAAQQVKEQLDRVGAKLVGVVLNKVPVNRQGYYYNHYYYYYNGHYGEDGEQPKRRNPFARLLRRRRSPAKAPAAERTPDPQPDASPSVDRHN